MNPQRRFFQIHLSTAVVLMLVAGVLVWANIACDVWRFGPASVREIAPEIRISQGSARRWAIYGAIVNVVIDLVLLLSICVVCEWRIRRRAARKANE